MLPLEDEERDVEMAAWREKQRQIESGCTNGWTLVMIVVFGAVGYFGRPYLLESGVGAIILSFVLFCILAYMLRQRTHGRAVTGGMEYGPIIAMGAVVLMWAGTLAATALATGELLYYPLTVVVGAAGIFVSHFGLKEGPVYGWE